MTFYSKHLLLLVSLMTGALFSAGCSTLPPLPQASAVNLQQFMGTWYIHGYTPIVVDKKAYNASERYELVEDRIETTYRFNKGGLDGPEKVFTPVGWVHNHESNAEWRMQFMWPFKSKYIIMYLDADRGETIIAHPNRKYAWIMSRAQSMEQATYQKHLDRLKQEGFDLERIQRVEHELPAAKI